MARMKKGKGAGRLLRGLDEILVVGELGPVDEEPVTGGIFDDAAPEYLLRSGLAGDGVEDLLEGGAGGRVCVFPVGAGVSREDGDFCDWSHFA